IYGYFDFPILLMVGEMLIAQFFPKRKYFWPKAIISIILVIFVFWLRPFGPIVKSIAWEDLMNFWSLIDFLVSFVALCVCFKATLSSYLMAGTIGFCLQNLSYSSTRSVQISTGAPEEWYFLMPVLLAIFSACYCFLYFVFIKKKNCKECLANITERSQFIIGAAIISIVSVLCGYGFKEAGRANDNTLYYVIFGYNIFASIIAIFSEFNIVAIKKAEQDNSKLKTLLAKDAENYAASKENYDSVRMQIHDVRHRLDALSDNTNKEAIEEIKNSLSIYSISTKTKCEALDLVLREKNLKFNKNKIRITCMVQASALNIFPNELLYSIFENAISNSIEATQELPEDQRIIALTSSDFGDFLNIHIENFCDASAEKANNGQTSKENKELHGFGIKSIRSSIELLGGKMSFRIDDNVFSLDLLFNMKKEGKCEVC
ncbi:MAG: GHKL domain-containing protein, partial [Bacilli bacterium]